MIYNSFVLLSYFLMKRSIGNEALRNQFSTIVGTVSLAVCQPFWTNSLDDQPLEAPLLTPSCRLCYDNDIVRCKPTNHIQLCKRETAHLFHQYLLLSRCTLSPSRLGFMRQLERRARLACHNHTSSDASAILCISLTITWVPIVMFGTRRRKLSLQSFHRHIIGRKIDSVGE